MDQENTKRCDLCCKSFDYLQEFKHDGEIFHVCKTCYDQEESRRLDDLCHGIFQKLAQEVNISNEGPLALAMSRALQREHRFLQSGLIQTLWFMFKHYQNAPTDARNEGAVAWAKKWFEAV
jgi:hypothetical protein